MSLVEFLFAVLLRIPPIVIVAFGVGGFLLLWRLGADASKKESS